MKDFEFCYAPDKPGKPALFDASDGRVYRRFHMLAPMLSGEGVKWQQISEVWREVYPDDTDTVIEDDDDVEGAIEDVIETVESPNIELNERQLIDLVTVGWVSPMNHGTITLNKDAYKLRLVNAEEVPDGAVVTLIRFFDELGITNQSARDRAPSVLRNVICEWIVN